MNIQKRLTAIENKLGVGQHICNVTMKYYEGDVLAIVSTFTVPTNYDCSMTLIRGSDYSNKIHERKAK